VTGQHKKGIIMVGNFCVSTICLPDVIARDQISQAFPLHIYILKAIKYWRWERPRNKATYPAYIQKCLYWNSPQQSFYHMLSPGVC